MSRTRTVCLIGLVLLGLALLVQSTSTSEKGHVGPGVGQLSSVEIEEQLQVGDNRSLCHCRLSSYYSHFLSISGETCSLA